MDEIEFKYAKYMQYYIVKVALFMCATYANDEYKQRNERIQLHNPRMSRGFPILAIFDKTMIAS